MKNVLSRTRWVALLVAPTLLSFSGCGAGSNLPTTVPAGGTATFEEDGSPVKQAQITFYGEQKKYVVAGRTDTSGKFEMVTADADGNSSPGAPPGKYKATVIVVGDEKIAMPPEGPFAAQEYGNMKTTPLEVEIPEAGNSNLVIKVKQGTGKAKFDPNQP